MYISYWLPLKHGLELLVCGVFLLFISIAAIHLNPLGRDVSPKEMINSKKKVVRGIGLSKWESEESFL